MQISLVIQAGGESRRMGQDKALIPFLGRPLVERVVERLAGLADEVLLTGHDPLQLAGIGLACHTDIFPGRGALSGLYTALEAARYPLVAVVACDLPFASRALLQAEAELVERLGVDAAVPRTAEGFEPFHAVYRRDTCLPAVLAALEAGEKRLIAWFPKARIFAVSTELVHQVDPQGLAFTNVNTPDELRLAEERARKESQSAANSA